jgi:carboxypeptidase Q
VTRPIALALAVLALTGTGLAQGASDEPDLAMYARIRDEGLSRSQVMDYAFELMDHIGPRLSGSPNLDRSVSWAVERMASASRRG